MSAVTASPDAVSEQSEQREYVEYMGVSSQEQLISLVGSPPTMRKSPIDAKMILVSQQASDKERYGYEQIIWPSGDHDVNKRGFHTVKEDREHILWRLYYSINEARWEKYTDENGAERWKPPIYIHSESPVFKRFQENDAGLTVRATGVPFKISGKPQAALVSNVIDRTDDYCATNRHTKVLTRGISRANKSGVSYQEGQVFAKGAVGVPLHAFMTGVADYLTRFKSYELELLIKRVGMNYHITPFNKDLATPDQVARAAGAYAGLKEEEYAYNAYNLDHLYKPSSYNQILDTMGSHFRDWQVESGNPFYDELVALAEEEKNNYPSEDEQLHLPIRPSSKTEHIPNTQSQTVEQADQTSEPTSDVSNDFPFYKDLTDQEKEYYGKMLAGDLAPIACDACGANMPIKGVNKCASCGVSYEE
jgi:hypothetical protein